MSSDPLPMQMSALGHQVRLSMYRQIIASGSEGIAQGRLASVLDIQHSLISYHLQPLLAAGLAKVERRGREMIYRADPVRLNRLAASILDLSSGGSSRDD